MGLALSEVSIRGSHWLAARDGGLCKILFRKYIMPSPFRFGKGPGLEIGRMQEGKRGEQRRYKHARDSTAHRG